MSKIIFLDVDGTLVDYENRIPESAVRAIRQARSLGDRVYIAGMLRLWCSDGKRWAGNQSGSGLCDGGCGQRRPLSGV